MDEIRTCQLNREQYVKKGNGGKKTEKKEKKEIVVLSQGLLDDAFKIRGLNH
jgi:hypothetical protein